MNYAGFSNYIGAGYVATTYPWESAGWYWSIRKKANGLTNALTTVKQATYWVNGGDNGLADRKVKYDTIKGIITE